MASPEDVLDMLVVGGGPAGTAAAFRAQELGVRSLVIDYDDLMKRIRDYSKDKLILPDFGGGDKMRFPEGGDLILRLHFQPIDKDEMCSAWKSLYVEHGISHRTAVELTGLEQRDGHYALRAWDHDGRREETLLARHVVLALGRGVPRRFDVPGNCDGIAFRLVDPADYVGGEACVLGGGTSAAEAVIAISRAKTQANDRSAVYWSYRGDRLPRVSKALAEAFFEAYIGNGNIRYHPLSEPAAVVVGDDHREYLAIRIDRVRAEGRPAVVTQLEFPKERCIACIGEDIPEALLNSLGIRMMTGGPKQKKRMVVNRFLESCLPNVYIIGDMLSQAYLETDDFAADPAGFREIQHRGNIKSAMADGVLLAEVVKQRLEGREQVVLPVAGTAESVPVRKPSLVLAPPAETAGPPPASLVEERRFDSVPARLVSVLPGGVTAEEYPLDPEKVFSIGREGCDATFPADSSLSPRHASIVRGKDGFVVRDDGAETGVFLRLGSGKKAELNNGDLVRLGRQFLLLASAEDGARLEHYDGTGTHRNSFTLQEGKLQVAGREAPDFSLDPTDKTLSRRHLSLQLAEGRIVARDLNSVNGSFVRVREARRLENGDEIRVGQQTLRLVTAEEAHRGASVEQVAADIGLPQGTPMSGPAVSPVSVAAPRVPSGSTAIIVTAGGGMSAVPGSPTPPSGTVPTPSSARESRASSPAVTSSGAREPRPGLVTTPAASSVASAATAAPMVTFKGMGTFPVAKGQTLCDVAEAGGLAITADCHAGICGSDPVRILEGKEFIVSEMQADEREALEEIAGCDPSLTRLACMVCVRGPVVVELVRKV